MLKKTFFFDRKFSPKSTSSILLSIEQSPLSHTALNSDKAPLTTADHEKLISDHADHQIAQVTTF